MMDMEKDKDRFLLQLADDLSFEELQDLCYSKDANQFYSARLADWFVDKINYGWRLWQAAKAQAVPEGFVLVPKLLSDELADELASDAFNNIQSMFDYEHRGSTATHREQIRLRWCKNKAREFQENYKIVIEAQEQKG